MSNPKSCARHDRARWHECPGLRRATHRSCKPVCKGARLQPYRAGAYRGTWQSPGLPRKLCMPSGTGGGVLRLFACHEAVLG
jgi:hypothetical protein